LSHWPRIGDFRGICHDSEFPKTLIFLYAFFERASRLTSKTRERDNAASWPRRALTVALTNAL